MKSSFHLLSTDEKISFNKSLEVELQRVKVGLVFFSKIFIFHSVKKLEKKAKTLIFNYFLFVDLFNPYNVLIIDVMH